MSEFLNWIKKHKVYTALIVLLVFLFPIFVIIYLNSVLSSSFFDNIGLSADSLITYIAGFEAFLGTVFLGIVAVRQNDKANDLNKRMLENEEKHKRFERQPSIMVLKVSREVINRQNMQYDITFFLVNVSKVYSQFRIEELCIGDLVGILSRNLPVGDGVVQLAPIGDLAPEAQNEFTFQLRDPRFQTDQEYPCNIKVRMLNSIGEIYIEKVSFFINFNSDDTISLSEFIYSIKEEK